MAPTSTSQILLSPVELSYLHKSLSLTPPIRPDGRSPTDFRPLIAECDILPGTNGSARICFIDGTEAICGIKAEVERSRKATGGLQSRSQDAGDVDVDMDAENEGGNGEAGRRGETAWLELSVEIPGFRDDDLMPVFLASLMSEALLADGEFTKKLWINSRFHWKLCIDILLLSPPLSYPLPLLSLTTHLALLSTRLPRLKSEGDEDPLFDDDWDASTFLYARQAPQSTGKSERKKGVSGRKSQQQERTAPARPSQQSSRPPITLLVICVGTNIIFDPSKEELAVAEAILAVSVSEVLTTSLSNNGNPEKPERDLHLLSIRTIDPPSRLTAPGVPNFLNTATGGDPSASSTSTPGSIPNSAAASGAGPAASTSGTSTLTAEMETETEGVWKARRGGTDRKVLARMIAKVLEKGGVAEEVLDGLENVDLD